MKKTTRIICLVLCLLTLSGCFAGCASKDTTVGPQINMYLSSEVYNLDPAYAHVDASASKVLGLLFEGLYKLEDNGKVTAAACDNWIYTEDEGVDKETDEDNIYKMVITIKDSAWSDGRALHADQFVYAWKRLLDPMFDGEGAELLYDIKGAWERKNLGESPDDIGLIADKEKLTIYFKHPIDPHEFERKLASLALLPVRQDCVEYYHSWSTANTTMFTNGPFTLQTFYPGARLELVRNIYYRYNTEDRKKDPTPSKHVTPYKITVDYTLNSEEIMQKYDEGELFYIGEIPASKEIREKYKEQAKIWDTLNTHTYLFNTTIAPFNNAAVRKALSDVISRNEIVSEIVFAKPATGIIPSGITDANGKDMFAANNQAQISGDSIGVDAAKAAIQASGIDLAALNGKVFELTVRVNTDAKYDEETHEIKDISKSDSKIYDTVDYVVAKMVVDKWNEVTSSLGFTFKVNPVNTVRYNEVTSSLVQFRDLFIEALYGTTQGGKWSDIGLNYKLDNKDDGLTASIKKDRGGFDIIAIDSQNLDKTAYSALSVFAANYSGSKGDFVNEDFIIRGHVTGYNNEIYNNLIAEASAERDKVINSSTSKEDKEAAKTAMYEKLHEAEQLLLSEMPIIPIFVHQNAVLQNKKLKNVDFSEWGYPIFNKTRLPGWEKYLPKTDAEEEEEE